MRFTQLYVRHCEGVSDPDEIGRGVRLKPAYRQAGNPQTTKCSRCSTGIATVAPDSYRDYFVSKQPRNDESPMSL